MKKVVFSLCLALSALGVVAPVVMPGIAIADPAQSKAVVDAAKARGEVGEAKTGYLAFVTGSGSPEVGAAVDEINAGRKAIYEAAAAKNNLGVDAAAASSYTQVILSKLKPGQYYQDISGKWVQK